MRRFLLTLVMSIAPICATRADAPSPADAGVRVEKPAGDGVHFMQGSGVYLGHGLVLTARHVVSVDSSSATVTVVMDGWRLSGTDIFDGARANLDLALIRIPMSSLSIARRAQADVSVCRDNPEPSHPVLVAALGTLSIAATIPTPITSEGRTGSWTNILNKGYHRGNSGGGVFKPGERCLWGILETELSGPSLRTGAMLDLTAFVPASDISAFLESYRREGAP